MANLVTMVSTETLHCDNGSCAVYGVVHQCSTASQNDASSLRRSPSIYTTDSAHSTVSGGTTISDIVEMYSSAIAINSYDSIGHGKDQHGSVFQPKAYRDTVAPILQKRFSFDTSDYSSEILPRTTFRPDAPTTNSSASERRTSGATFHHEEKAPSFLDFSRSLQLRKAQSPYQVHLQRVSSNPSNALLGEVDPVFPAESLDSNLEQKALTMVPTSVDLSPRYRERNSSIEMLETERTMDSRLEQPGPNIQASRSRTSSAVPKRPLTSPQPEARPPVRTRYYNSQVVVEQQRPTDDQTRPTNVFRAVKARVKNKQQQRRESRDLEAILSAASQRYPAMQQGRKGSWVGGQRRSITSGVGSLVRSLSAASPTKPTPAVKHAECIRQAAIPLTAYQMCGPQVLKQQVKQELREEKKNARKLAKAPKTIHTHKLSFTESCAGTTFEKSTGISKRSVFEGIKAGLTRNSSEKRRERLKASIVLVGPTTITERNAAPEYS